MKIIKVFACMAAALLMLCAYAMAAPAIDTDQSIRLTINCDDNGEIMQDMEFFIFRIASIDENGKKTTLAPFDQYNVDLDISSESSLAGAAMALEGYVMRDGIAYTDFGVATAFGDVYFPTSGSLQQGVYLVMANRYINNNKIYTFQPTILQLPAWDSASESWIYDVIINPKFQSVPDDPDPELLTRKVLKVWADEGNEDARPDEIEVQLLMDGEVFDTVALNDENNWRNTWRELDPDHYWTLTEKEINDYSVTVMKEGITFVVTNSFIVPDIPVTPHASDSPSPSTSPDASVSPSPSTSPEPSVSPDQPTPTPRPGNTPTPRPGNTPGGGKLPQTGQLWWPVPMLVCAGMMLIIIGLLRRRGH